jgi:hypothetical protein
VDAGWGGLERIGAVLGVPASCLYEADDTTAEEFLLVFHKLPSAMKAKTLDAARKLVSHGPRRSGLSRSSEVEKTG